MRHVLGRKQPDTDRCLSRLGMQMSELEAANAELEDANTQMEAVIMRRDELEAQSSSQIASLTSELQQSQASFSNSRKRCGC